MVKLNDSEKCESVGVSQCPLYRSDAWVLCRKSIRFEPRQRYADRVRLLALIVLTAFANVWASHASADKLAGGVLAQKGSAGYRPV